MRRLLLCAALVAGCPAHGDRPTATVPRPGAPDAGRLPDAAPLPDTAAPPDLRPPSDRTAPDAAPARSTVTVEAPQHVRFARNSAQLGVGARAVLDRLARSMGKTGAIRVEGHADRREKSAAVLSLRRARAVRDYLVGRGIPPDRVEAKGYGATRPLGPPGSPPNRRVEFSGLDAVGL